MSRPESPTGHAPAEFVPEHVQAKRWGDAQREKARAKRATQGGTRADRYAYFEARIQLIDALRDIRNHARYVDKLTNRLVAGVGAPKVTEGQRDTLGSALDQLGQYVADARTELDRFANLR